jgi:DNA repair protein SbcD/Mre11
VAELIVAVTADVHLSAGSDHPERYNALISILDILVEKEVHALVMAGDLFDRDTSDYSRFEEVCRRYPAINFYIIPGNHDPDISRNSIVGDNIRIFTSPAIESINGLQFVFIPYSEKYGMGECLEGVVPSSDQWVLIGHGDYFGGLKHRNPYEKGIYMPLYREDIDRFSPWKVFLGHIHKPIDTGNLYYPGSPCGIDINETGKRKFILFDTSTGKIAHEPVMTDVIYFREKFLVIPDDSEVERLGDSALKRIESWGLTAEERGKARVRVVAAGFSCNRDAVSECLRGAFSDFTFSGDEGPDISRLLVAKDSHRTAIARRVIELLEEMDWKFGGSEPDKEEVIEAALSIVYGESG